MITSSSFPRLVTFLAATNIATATTLLDDHFDDGVIGSNTLGIGGGFISTDNGFGPAGSVTESSSQAKIVEGGTANRHGIESSNSFDLSDDTLSHTIKWEVAGWASQGNSGARRIGLGLRSYPDSQAIPSNTSALSISVDDQSNNISLTFTHRTSGIATTHSTAIFELDSSFSGDSDGFDLTLTLDVTGYNISTVGLNNSTETNLSGTWASLSDGGTDFNTVLGADGPMFINASIQNQSVIGATLDLDRVSATQVEPVIPGPILEWNPTGPGDAVSLYQEANWIDPETGKTPPSGIVDPNIALNRSLIIRAGIPGGGGGAGGSLMLGTGDLTLSGATLRMNQAQGSGINLGSGLKNFTITNSKVFTQAVAGGNVIMDGYSDLTLYGPNPLNTGSTVDFRSDNCFVYYLDKLPSAVIGSELSKFSVNGAPAVVNTNVLVTQYYNGAVIRPKLANNQVMKGFDGPDLTGTKWNFSTGFKGRIGLGLVQHNDGIYNVDGWGSDIWGTADECRFTYRDMTGDSEIIAKVPWVENAHVWSKGGVMMRADTTAGSANAFVFQRPDKQVAFQTRTAAGGTTSIVGPLGGTGSVKWVRLVRSGNNFSGYYSTSSAAGPWTQIGTATSITMPATIKSGIAATSHLGLMRSRTNFHEVSTVPATSGSIGIFTDSVDIESPWWIENRISSFLLKKGYMVTVSTKGGGQGVSQVYIATEADLTVNLPASLDNQICCMRVLPWRWIAKKGWGGSRTDHQTLLQTYWNYEWEPTGSSGTNREFVPMIKGRGQNNDTRWLEVRSRANQTHFLCFNEPESANQGDLSVDEALALWPKAQQLGLRLGSPGRTDGNNGNNWLSSFMTQADAKGYRVDFVSVHNYNKKTAASLKTWLTAEYNKYNRPIWLTEFQRDAGDNPTAAQHEAYLAEVIPMLEDLGFIERYAYFDFNTGGVTSSTASLFNNGPVLNTKGQIYHDIVSNPGYRNTGQPNWATVSLDQPNGQILQASDGGVITATTSIVNFKVTNVEFFVNGVSVGSDNTSPYELPISSLGQGLQSIHTVVTTNFGEQVVSPTRQVFVTDFGLLDSSPGPTGEISWATVPGETYTLRSSPDLLNWTTVEERTAIGFMDTASDPAWGTEEKMFYHVRWD